MPTQEKVESVASLRESLGTAKTAVLTEYRGLTVRQLSDLRKQLKALADLPSKEALRSQLVGALQGPLSQLVSLLTAPQRELVQVLEARSKQAGEQPAAS